MKGNCTVIGTSIALLISSGAALFPMAGMAADENDMRRQEAQARRDIQERERAQVEALRSQEEAIRRMETTQARMQAEAQQRDQQSAEQSRLSVYPYYPIVPSAPRLQAQPRQDDPVGAINFAPLSDRLKSYFGAQSGVLIVSAGSAAPFGLHDGDVIISIDGRVPVDGPHASSILRSYRPGERVKLRLQRDRRTIDVEATAPGQRSN
jgi:hypothetical protein